MGVSVICMPVGSKMPLAIAGAVGHLVIPQAHRDNFTIFVRHMLHQKKNPGLEAILLQSDPDVTGLMMVAMSCAETIFVF